MNEPFTVFRQKKLEESSNSGKQIWCVQYRNPQTGERMGFKRLNKINQELYGINAPEIRTKAQAFKVAQAALDKGLVISMVTGDVLFSEYAIKTWDYDTSDYIRRRNKAKANSICRNYADLQMSCLRNNVLPNLPAKLKLRDFKRSHAERVKDRLLDKGLASGTINKAMQVIRTALKEAYRTGLISENIADRVDVAANYACLPFAK